MAELDRRYLNTLPTEERTLLEVLLLVMIPAFADHDEESVRASMADDFVSVDRRRVGWPEMDKEAYLADRFAPRQVELGDLEMTLKAVYRTSPAVVVFRTETTVSATGYVLEAINVGAFRDGMCTRNETYELHDLDAAIARFDELEAETGSTDLTNETGISAESQDVEVDLDETDVEAGSTVPRHAVANHASETTGRFIGLILADDLDGAAELISESFRRIDCRPGVSGPPLEGRWEYVHAAAGVKDVGFESVDTEPVAVRGEWQGSGRPSDPAAVRADVRRQLPCSQRGRRQRAPGPSGDV